MQSVYIKFVNKVLYTLFFILKSLRSGYMLSIYITSQLPTATGTMLDSAGLQAEEAQALHQTTVNP